MIGQFLLNIMDDFRHLLALIIVLIFAIVLGYAMLRAGGQQVPGTHTTAGNRWGTETANRRHGDGDRPLAQLTARRT